MTSVALPGGFFVPPAPTGVSTVPSINTTALSAAGHKIAYIMESPVTDSIEAIHFYVINTVTGGDLDVRIETVGTDGLPTGTLWATNTNIVETLLSTDVGVWKSATLAAPASVAQGDMFAVVLTAGSPFSATINSRYDDARGSWFPYILQDITGAWVFQTGSPTVCVEFANSGFPAIPGLYPFRIGTANSFQVNTASGNVYGNKITLPYTCTVSGAWVWADMDGDADVILYDSDGTTILTKTSITASQPPSTQSGVINVIFPDNIVLSAGVSYYIGLKSTTTTSNGVTRLTFISNAASEQFQNANLVVHALAKDPTGTGSWTEDASSIMTCGLWITEIDMPSSGGSGGSFTFIGG